MSAQGDGTEPEEPHEVADTGEGVDFTRRKLAYVAPVLLSRAMFYGAAGCGKHDPRSQSCQIVRKGSS
jgi:hypothetical protein